MEARARTFTDADRVAAVMMAKIAENAERYHEMAYFMRLVAEHHGNLTVEERSLLSVAYRNLVGNVRASWRIVSSIEQREQARSDLYKVSRVEQYRAKIEGELRAICNDIIPLLDHLLAQQPPGDARVFYYKMKGDYYRYFAEFTSGEERRIAAQHSMDAYADSRNVACTDLPATSPIRLGLALSFATFTYEILNEPERACALAKQAFDDAIAELDQLDEDNYKESTLLMQLMRDSLTLWTSDIQDEQVEKIP